MGRRFKSGRKDVMPIHVANLRNETWGMSSEQFGAYFLLAIDIWVHGPIPYDDEQLARVARVPLSRWLKIGPYILRFLIIRDGKVDIIEGQHFGRAGRQPISPSLRAKIMERDSFACVYCKTADGPFEIDHIVPVSRGGANDPDNLCVACVSCNRSKRDALVAEWIG